MAAQLEKIAEDIVKKFEQQMGEVMENLEAGEMAFDDLNGAGLGLCPASAVVANTQSEYQRDQRKSICSSGCHDPFAWPVPSGQTAARSTRRPVLHWTPHWFTRAKVLELQSMGDTTSLSQRKFHPHAPQLFLRAARASTCPGARGGAAAGGSWTRSGRYVIICVADARLAGHRVSAISACLAIPPLSRRTDSFDKASALASVLLLHQHSPPLARLGPPPWPPTHLGAGEGAGAS